MSARYFLSNDQPQLSRGIAILRDAEARHLIRVMRAKPGDEVLLFNGDGKEFPARVEKVGHHEVELTILETREVDNSPAIELTAAVALPKGDRQKWLIEKLTELGVRRFVPLAVEREDIKIDDGVLTRLRRQVIEASKQCGRSRLMEILPRMSRRELDARFPFDDPMSNAPEGETLKIMTHPISDGWFHQITCPELTERFFSGKMSIPRKVLLVIGPVGGFSDSEVQEAVDDGWPILDLGKQVYRVETAAIVAASFFLHLL